MSLSLKEFEKLLEEIAPKRYLMEGDSYGWLTKAPEKIDSIVVAVDLPERIPKSSTLILHHKPLALPPTSTFILHTPLDRCDGGCHESLLKAFGFKSFSWLKNRLGVVTEENTKPETLLQTARKLFKNTPIRYSFFRQDIKKVAFFSGCGLNYLPFLKECVSLNVDLVISGDLTYKSLQFLLYHKISFIDVLHPLTEVFGLQQFCQKLSKYVKTTFIPPEVSFDVCIG